MNHGVKKSIMREAAHKLLGTGLGKSSNFPIAMLRKILMTSDMKSIDSDSGKDRIRVAYTMLVMATFLTPTGGTAKVSDEALSVISDPSKIGSFDWAKLVVEVLQEGAKRVQSGLNFAQPKVEVQGCLHSDGFVSHPAIKFNLHHVLHHANADRLPGLYGEEAEE